MSGFEPERKTNKTNDRLFRCPDCNARLSVWSYGKKRIMTCGRCGYENIDVKE